MFYTYISTNPKKSKIKTQYFIEGLYVWCISNAGYIIPDNIAMSPLNITHMQRNFPYGKIVLLIKKILKIMNIMDSKLITDLYLLKYFTNAHSCENS